MTYNSDPIQNVPILHYFNFLQAEKLEPKLSIYRGRTLMITSYKANDFLGKINQYFLKVQTLVFSVFYMLDEDPAKIEKMKNQVILFHFEQCEKSAQMQERMKASYELEKVKIDQKKCLSAYNMVFDENTNRLIFQDEKKNEL